jgi:hypothetical protein
MLAAHSVAAVALLLLSCCFYRHRWCCCRHLQEEKRKKDAHAVLQSRVAEKQDTAKTKLAAVQVRRLSNLAPASACCACPAALQRL